MILELSKELYLRDALNRTIYDLSSKCIFVVSELDDNYLLEISTNDILSDKEIEAIFLKNLCDHQVRIELEQKFSTIRNLLVAKAIESGLALDNMNLSND